MNNLLESVEDLMKLNRDELDEVLLDPKYNKPNLRQQLRQALAVASSYKENYRYQRELNEKSKNEKPLQKLILMLEMAADEMDVSEEYLFAEIQRRKDDDE